MAEAEPKIIVSTAEYMREVRYFRTLRERRRKLYSEWGRYASLWRWRRRPEDLMRLRAVIGAVWANIREEREHRRLFRRKVRMPYWRIGVAYMFRKEVRTPPYLFYAEFRKTVYTRHPEKYAEMDPKTLEWVKPKPWLEEELREIMFASSVLARRTKTDSIAHAEWMEALSKIKVFPFPDFEASAISKEEVEAPLDTQVYYVRIQKGTKEVKEYNTADVEGWLRAYRDWIREKVAEGSIRHPIGYMKAVRQTTIDEYAEWWERLKKAKGGRKTSA